MKKLKSRIACIMLIVVLILSGTNLFGFAREVKAAPSGEMAVHFLDVGQGLSILVQSEGQTLLYDGGDRSASSFVVSYLKEQKIKNIDYLISSHYDEDHLSGLVGCMKAFSVSSVIGADYIHNSKLYQSFMDSVSSKGLEVQHPEVGTTFNFGAGTFTILAPSYIGNDSNENSVAIKVTNGENSFIFTGDAEFDSEADMVNSGLNLDCDVLSVGHHGSASSTSWDFLAATVPEYAVISCGAGNQYDHPDKDTMDKLSDMEINVFRTDKQGTIVGVSNGTDITWNQRPCNDYTPGNPNDAGTTASGSEEASYAESLEDAQDFPVEESTGTPAWLSATGSKYHSIPDCGTMNPDKAFQTTREEAEATGYEACKKCW